MTGEEMLRTTAGELDRLLSPAHVVGSPLDLGERVVIPVVEYGFGLGAGEGKGPGGSGGGGSGGGGGISPVALVILEKQVKGPEGIQIYTLRKEGPLAQAVTVLSEKLAPQAVEAIKAMAAGRGRGKETEGKTST
jgi:uncharacterized spore protein YtfJ